MVSTIGRNRPRAVPRSGAHKLAEKRTFLLLSYLLRTHHRRLLSNDKYSIMIQQGAYHQRIGLRQGHVIPRQETRNRYAAGLPLFAAMARQPVA